VTISDELKSQLDCYERDIASTHNYPDLHDHVQNLADAGLLLIIEEPVNIDTIMHPLVRWQYSGSIPEPERRAWRRRTGTPPIFETAEY
jgi:hypothetical protein